MKNIRQLFLLSFIAVAAINIHASEKVLRHNTIAITTVVMNPSEKAPQNEVKKINRKATLQHQIEISAKSGAHRQAVRSSIQNNTRKKEQSVQQEEQSKNLYFTT